MSTGESGRNWPSRGYKTLSWISKILLVPALIFSLFFLVKGLITSVSHWSGWTGTEWSALGAWAGAAAAAFLASVSVWQTHRANEQARAAEARADREVENAEKRHAEQMAHATRTTSDELERLRNEAEYQAVQEILNSIATVASEVGAMEDLVDTFKKKPSEVTTAQLFEGRKNVVSHTNVAAIKFMMALPRLADKELLEQAYNLHETMHAVLKSFNGTDPNHPAPDWHKAADNLRPMLEALRDMQSFAIGYFSVYKKMREAGEVSEDAA